MNRFAVILSASALSAIAFGTESNAASSHHPSGHADTKTQAAVDTLSADHFKIIRLDKLKHHDPAWKRHSATSTSSHEARRVQASVIANKTLSRKLQASGIELTHIIAADRNADGGVTFYLR